MAGKGAGVTDPDAPRGRRWPDRRWPVLLPLAVIAVLVLVGVVQSRSGDGRDGDDPMARLAIIDPSVAVQAVTAGSFGPAVNGRALAMGDVLQTDAQGRAQVDYADGSLTRLDHDTTFAVEKLAVAQRPDPLAVRVDVGRTWHEVAELTTTGERFKASTSNAVATVRGTVFTVDHTREQVSTFALLEGLLEVAGRAGGGIVLHPGESVTVGPGGTLGPVNKVSFDDLSRVDEWIRFNLGLRPPRATTTTAGGATTTSSTTTTTTTRPRPPGTASPPTTAAPTQPTTAPTTAPRTTLPPRPVTTTLPVSTVAPTTTIRAVPNTTTTLRRATAP